MPNIIKEDITKCHEAALDYLNLGYSIVPIKKGEKSPCVPWKDYQLRQPTVEEVNSWYANFPDAQIGIITGKVSGIVVVDIDKKNGGLESMKKLSLPPTITAKTGGGGLHYFYRTLDSITIKNSVGSIAPGIDIRGEGGQVLVAPSIHASGNAYEFTEPLVKPENLGEFPMQLLEHINTDKQEFRFENLLTGAPEGQRNNAAASFIGSIIKPAPMQTWETNVWPAVLQWNKVNTPPLPEIELRKTFESICRLELQGRISLQNPLLFQDTPIKPTDFIITSGAELATKEPKPFPWLVYGLVPEGAITAITAESGKGKSLFALIMAKAVAKGEKLFGGFEVKRNKVLIIDQEMDEDIIVGRYKSIVGDEWVDIDFVYEQFWNIGQTPDYNWLCSKIKEQGYGLVIFDTLTAIHSMDENSAGEMKELNKLMLRITRETKATVVYLHHHRKPHKGEKNSLTSARGSTEIIAKVASLLVIESRRSKDAQGRTINSMVVKQEKARRPESITAISCELIHDSANKKTEVIYLGEVEEDIAAVATAKNQIVKYLQEHGGKVTIKDLKIKLIIGENNLRKACKELQQKDQILGSEKGTGRQHGTDFFFLIEQGEEKIRY